MPALAALPRRRRAFSLELAQNAASLRLLFVSLVPVALALGDLGLVARSVVALALGDLGLVARVVVALALGDLGLVARSVVALALGDLGLVARSVVALIAVLTFFPRHSDGATIAQLLRRGRGYGCARFLRARGYARVQRACVARCDAVG